MSPNRRNVEGPVVESELYVSQRPLRQMLEKLPVGAYICDADGLIVYYNHHAILLWGRAPRLNNPIDRYCGSYRLFSTAGSLIAHDRCWMARALQTDSEFNGEEIVVERENGTRLTALAHARPLHNDMGALIGAVNILVDISDRQRAAAAVQYSEKRYRTLLEATTSVVWNTDPNGQFVMEQPAWERFTGQSFEQYQGLGWLNAVHPTERTSTVAAWQAAVASRSIFQVQARVSRYGNDYRHTLIHAVPISDDQDQVREWIGSLSDITSTVLKQAESQAELRQREAELRVLNETLENRVQERTLEVEKRSHQLRGLALDLADTESRERKRLAQVLHDHFQQLVSAAKLKTGMVRRVITDTRAITLLEQTERLLEEAITASRSLATELSPPMLHDAGLIPALEWLSQKMEADYGLRVRVLAHPAAAPESEQLRTLLFECARELLFNVVKHAGVKEAKLTLNISSDGVLSLVVSDAGMGFDMHETGANSKRNETSFGLFSIRERLSFLGGLLNIRSAPGEGTRVELSVPVGVSNTAASTPSHPENSILADRPSASRRAMDRPARVLVADDHKLFRDGIIALLSQEAGLTIVGEAADGLEAVKLARALKPDILILDVSMPKLNGIQVATQVSRELPQTCIIGLSMHEDRDMAKAMRDAGATAYLTKGGSSESFLELLRSLTILKSTGP